jgi:hypothetical protein
MRPPLASWRKLPLPTPSRHSLFSLFPLTHSSLLYSARTRLQAGSSRSHGWRPSPSSSSSQRRPHSSPRSALFLYLQQQEASAPLHFPHVSSLCFSCTCAGAWGLPWRPPPWSPLRRAAMAGLPWSRRSQQPWLPPSVAPRCFFSQGTGAGDNSISPLGATFRQGSRELFLPCAQEPHGRARPSLHRRRPLGTRDPLPLYPIPSPTPHFISDLWHTAAAAMASIFFSLRSDADPKDSSPGFPPCRLHATRSTYCVATLSLLVVQQRTAPLFFPVGAAAPTSPRDSLLCAAQ